MAEYGYLPERQRSEGRRPPSEGGSAHEQIYASLLHWVEHHPNPDAPALSIAGSGDYSPRELLEAVGSRSDVGQFFEAMIVNGASIYEDGLEGVLRSFRDESNPFRSKAQSFDL
jgi:hypothetical protein